MTRSQTWKFPEGSYAAEALVGNKVGRDEVQKGHGS